MHGCRAQKAGKSVDPSDVPYTSQQEGYSSRERPNNSYLPFSERQSCWDRAYVAGDRGV